MHDVARESAPSSCFISFRHPSWTSGCVGCHAAQMAARRRLSPVAAFVVAGRLSRSFFTAVTPIPYSIPGFSPARAERQWGVVTTSPHGRAADPRRADVRDGLLSVQPVLPVIVASVRSPGPLGNTSSPWVAPEMGLYFTR